MGGIAWATPLSRRMVRADKRILRECVLKTRARVPHPVRVQHCDSSKFPLLPKPPREQTGCNIESSTVVVLMVCGGRQYGMQASLRVKPGRCAFQIPAQVTVVHGSPSAYLHGLLHGQFVFCTLISSYLTWHARRDPTRHHKLLSAFRGPPMFAAVELLKKAEEVLTVLRGSYTDGEKF